MYIHELAAFIAVADQGSFLRAAEKLFLTPASVMNQMNKLEKIAGVKLLVRTNQGTELTEAGRSLYADAKKMMALSEASLQRARKIARSEQTVIRVGTSLLRPCKKLVELWANIDDGSLPFKIKLVPFDDSPAELAAVLAGLGAKADCIISPCDSDALRQNYNICVLEYLPCRIAVPRRHRLEKKQMLTWEDLAGETFYLIEEGDSPILDEMRQEIGKHADIAIANVGHFYDTAVFNECEKNGYIMETLDIWNDIHPSLVTLPMEWQYEMPYGIIYAKNPSAAVERFIECVKRNK